MEIGQLAPEVFVSAQITFADLELIANEGIKSIINNRPDGEDVGQPTSADLAAAAAELGMSFVHIPVVMNSITQQDVDDLANACSTLEGPMLLFCRSGTRSAILWNLSTGQG